MACWDHRADPAGRPEFGAQGLGLGFRLILLNGPPAIGKAHFARRVAQLAGLPLVGIDLGTGTEGFREAGVSRGWGTAQPGRPVEEILSTGVGNPVVLVDEVDNGGASYGTDGSRTSAWTALLGLLEPGMAKAW